MRENKRTMGRYKRYLFTGGQIPAATIRSRLFRKRRAAANALNRDDQNKEVNIRFHISVMSYSFSLDVKLEFICSVKLRRKHFGVMRLSH